MTNPHRILLIDDDPEILRMIKLALMDSFDLTTAEDGHRAIKTLQAEEFDVVIADQNLPGPSGIDILELANTEQPSTIRMLMTAAQHFDDIQNAVNRARIHRFISKPLRIMELSGAINGAVRERQLEQENKSLVTELRQKNGLLNTALTNVREHERKLEEEVKSRTEELRCANRELETLACRDSLTGLFNRRFFDAMLASEISRAERQKKSLGLLFLDVDHFKNYNDTLGHPAGDSALQTLGRILSSQKIDCSKIPPGRKSDLAARYGGEEFVMILPDTDKTGALVRADRIRQAVEHHSFYQEDVQPLGKVTISVGVSSYPEDAGNIQDLIHVADKSVLRAKKEGRNRIWSRQHDGHSPAAMA